MNILEGMKRMVDRQLELGKKEHAQKKKDIESLFSERKRVSIIISGKVQGVFFRDFVEKTATGLNLTGFVRNIAGGSVEVEAEGDKERLEELIKACDKGPKWAVVTKIEVRWKKFRGEFSEFLVKV